MRARGNPDARYTPYPSRNSFYTQSQQQQLGQFVQDHSQQQPEQLPDQQPYFQVSYFLLILADKAWITQRHGPLLFMEKREPMKLKIPIQYFITGINIL